MLPFHETPPIGNALSAKLPSQAEIAASFITIIKFHTYQKFNLKRTRFTVGLLLAANSK